ncbi:MAG: DUF763 domain-containing protein [Nitrososphaerales archaeon]
MRRTGFAVLPLHSGHAPQWLILKMKSLAREISKVLVYEYGSEELLRRFSDPFWFQAFGCVLGFDWHSSGLTTVVCGVLKEALSFDEHGVKVLGGKGRKAKNTLKEIEELANERNFSESKIKELSYASRMCAKVDNAAIQDGYQIYHHSMIISEKGQWSIIQQGLDYDTKTARRYHWLCEKVKSFIDEPHTSIVGEIFKDEVLDMTSKKSEENRKVCVDLVKSNTNNLISSIRLLSLRQASLDPLLSKLRAIELKGFEMPRNLNWKLFKEIYEFQPRNYEELLAFRGFGPSSVRALALIAELIYGAEASWKDPVKFSFAHGGKDGVPFPVNKRDMDKSIEFLKEALEASKIGDDEKRRALIRLSKLGS